MSLAEQMKQRAMSAINSKETTAMIKSVQQGKAGLAQQIMSGATTGLKTVVSEVGWQQLAGAAAVYLAHIRQQEKQKGTTPHHNKNHNRQIGRDYEY